jgi:glycosyltransferase involved in cell wall biosynthesis
MKIVISDPSKFTAPYDYSLCNSLVENNVDITVLTSKFMYGEEIPNKKYTEIEFFYKYTNKFFKKKSTIFFFFKTLEHIKNSIELLFYLKQHKVNVYHLQWLVIPKFDYFILNIIKLLGVKVVFTAHNILPHDSGTKYYKIYNKIYHLVNFIIAHTATTKNKLELEFNLASSKIIKIEHGDFNYLNEYNTKRIDIIQKNELSFTMIMFGAVKPYKGLDVLIEALHLIDKSILPYIKLLVVGRVSDSYIYLDKVNIYNLNNNIIFIDEFIADSEVFSYMKLADIGVLPYKSIDQSGAALAMASFGLPLLASNIGGLKDIIIDDYNGWLVQPSNAKDLSIKISQIYMKKHKLGAMCKNMKTHVTNKFSWDVSSKNTIKIYKSLMDLGV